MQFALIITAAALVGLNTVNGNVVKRAVINGPCTGEGGAPGVCIATAKCTSGGGKFITNACPGTANDIKCCTKTACGTGGNCRWTSDCQGTTVANQCPGPASFKCCTGTPGTGGPAPGGENNFPTPPPLKVGACKQVAVDGAAKIVAAFPTKVREIGCTRDCACGSGSDHCCGRATDMMNSKAAGVRTEEGSVMAEWVMKNRVALNLKYVIWGQRIWESGAEEKPWPQWRLMEDRGGNTANHWDHVHVSYKG